MAFKLNYKGTQVNEGLAKSLDNEAFTLTKSNKLDGIADGATNQTDAEIKIQYENNSDTNALTDELKSTLDNLQYNAIQDMIKSGKPISIGDNVRLCLRANLFCIETMTNGGWTVRNRLGHHFTAPNYNVAGGYTGLTQTIETAEWETFQEEYNLVVAGTEDNVQKYGDTRKKTYLVGNKDSYNDVFIPKQSREPIHTQFGSTTNAIDLPSPFIINSGEPMLYGKYSHDIPIEPNILLTNDELGFNWYEIAWYDDRIGGVQDNGSAYCYKVTYPNGDETGLGLGANEIYGSVGFETADDFDIEVLQHRCIESNKVYYSLEEFKHLAGNGGTTPQGALESTIVGGKPTISWNREFDLSNNDLFLLRIATNTSYTLGSDGTYAQIEAIIHPYKTETVTTSEDIGSNGFTEDQKDGITLTYDDVTRTFTITPATDSFFFYEKGKRYDIQGSDSVVWEDLEGEHWFYYNLGVLTAIHEPSNELKKSIILENAFVATIYWNNSSKNVELGILDERHGKSMSPFTHYYLHLTRGAQYLYGLGLSDIISTGNGSLNSHAQFGTTPGSYLDEDIEHSINEVVVGSTIPVVYNLGVNANIRVDEQTGFGVLNAPAGRLYYNQNNGGDWKLTEVADRDFVLYHIFAINGITTQIVSIMGQNEYGSSSDARSGANEEIANILSLLPFAEFIPLGTIIYQTRSSYNNDVSARIVQTDTGGDYVDWRSTEIVSGSNPSSHLNLTDLELAGSGVTWGHIDDQPQSIAGQKTFLEPIVGTITPKESAIYDRTYGSGTINGGNPVFQVFTNQQFNDSSDIVKVSNGKVTLKAGGKYKLEAFINCACSFVNGYVDFRFYNATDAIFFGIQGTIILSTNGGNSGSVVQSVAFITTDTDKDVELQFTGGDQVDAYYGAMIIQKM